MHSYDLELRERYKIRLLLMCLEEGGVLEVVLSERRKMAYLWKGRGVWSTGVRGKLYKLITKWTSSKTVSKHFSNNFRAPLIVYFWKSIYCIKQNMHISEYINITFLKELAIFLECKETFENFKGIFLLHFKNSIKRPFILIIIIQFHSNKSFCIIQIDLCFW